MIIKKLHNYKKSLIFSKIVLQCYKNKVDNSLYKESMIFGGRGL